jgi:hypothetical protein
MASLTWREGRGRGGITLAEGLYDRGGRTVPPFNFTLAFALHLRKSTKTLSQGTVLSLTADGVYMRGLSFASSCLWPAVNRGPA